ncbi:MAG: T9SS type A sorting domain-containing protein [Bacteroidia bacterium]
MKCTKLFLSIAVLIYSSLKAQITQEWSATTPYFSPLYKSEIRLLQDGISVFNWDQSNGLQQGWKVNYTGETVWNFEHEQTNFCTNCSFVNPTAVAIRSDGMAFQAGAQAASPNGAGFITRINADGSLQFSNNYVLLSGDIGFIDAVFSNSESELILSGREDSPLTGQPTPYLYRFSLDGELLLSKDIGIQNFETYRIATDENGNVYANAETLDTIRLVSFDANFNQRWEIVHHVPGYTGEGNFFAPIRFSNGDFLFAAYFKDYNTFTDVDLHLFRIDTDGNEIWHAIKELDWVNDYSYAMSDLHIDANDNVLVYFDRLLSQGGGGIALETNTPISQRIASGSVIQIRPLLLKFGADGVYQWDYLTDGVSQADTEDNFYSGKIASDELGNIIVSAANANVNAGAFYSVLTPDGSVNSTLYVPENLETLPQSLVYAGNQVFYSNNLGSVNDSSAWTINKFSYSISPTTSQSLNPDNIIVFPNPSTGVFRWYNTDLLCKELKIINLSGRVVASIPVNGSGEFVINLENEPAGLYLVNTGKTMFKLNIVR